MNASATHVTSSLSVLNTAPARKPRNLALRWAVVGLALAAVVLYAVSYTQPWWNITLFAPQYPKGLSVTISLTGVSGDVGEINTLNHYIGMAKLEEAAPVERRLAGWGVAAVGILVLALSLLSGRRLSALMMVPGMLFPTLFIVDNMYWMHRFGNNLDPKAPLKIPPFTPSMFGEGVIAQFRTFATPQLGFWLVLVALGLLTVAFYLRRRVCASCSRAGSCGAVCPSALVGPGAGLAR
ncbi:MAG: cytochrome C [Myxococcota bacterium]